MLFIMLAFLLVGCDLFGGGVTGTYYEYIDGEKQEDSFFVIDRKNWRDDEGTMGTYKINGNVIDFYVDFFGSQEVLISGTIEKGIIKLDFLGDTRTYAKDGKMPKKIETSELTILDNRITKEDDELFIKLSEYEDYFDFTGKFEVSKGTYFKLSEYSSGTGSIENNTVYVSGYSKTVYLVIKDATYDTNIIIYKLNITRDLPFSVNFYNENGNLLDTLSVRSGNKITGYIPSLPGKTGMSFVGWGIREGGTLKPVDFSKYIVTGHVDLFPIYTYNQYKVNYNIEYDFELDGTYSYATYNNEYTLTVPTGRKPGYSFDGWKDSFNNRLTDKNGNSLNKYLTTADIQVFPIWVQNTYNVNVSISNSNAGVVTKSKTTAKYEDVIVLTTTNNNTLGYRFVGWYDGDVLVSKNPTYEFYMPDKSINYVAKYEFVEYNIKYVLDGAQNNENNITKYNIETGTFYFSNPEKEFYTFKGWYFNGKLISSLNLSTTLSDIELIALFEPSKYNITLLNDDSSNPSINVGFHPNGGSGTFETRVATMNSGPALPSIPTRSGYIFVGWNTKPDGSGTTYDLSKTFTSDVILYANWIPSTTVSNYHETFINTRTSLSKNLGNYNFAVISTGTERSITLEINNSSSYYYNMYTVIAPNGTTLSTNNYGTYTINNPMAGIYVVKAYPYYSTSSYTFRFGVTYDRATNFGYAANAIATTTYDEYATLTVPSKKNYSFLGWYTQPGGKGEKVTDEKGNLLKPWAYSNVSTLYAYWQSKTYTLKYHLNGGTNSSENVTSLGQISGEFVLRPAEKDFNTFAGWFDSDLYKNEITTIYEDMWGDVELYAKFIPNSYNINYVVGMSGATNNNPTKRDYGTIVNLYDAVKNGYKFLGWYDQEVGGNKVTYIASDLHEDITLYGRWEIINYTITYVLNGGTNPEDQMTTYTINSATYTLLNPTKEHYVFEGWYTNSNFTGNRVYNIPAASYGNKTFYAKFTLVNYQINYTLNGGSLSGGQNTYTYESEFNLPIPTRTGYKFLGWYDQATGGNKVEKIEKNSFGTKNFYARWQIEDYTITYVLNGGTNPENQITTYNINTPTYTLLNPTKEHYTFEGWYTNANFTGSRVYSISSGSTGDRTYYAKFVLTNYSITYYTNGGSLTGGQTTYTYESEFDLAIPTRTGYEFLGWYDQATGGNKVERIEKNSYGTKTFYARWQIKEYTITYVLNGGSNNLNQETYTIETDTFTLLGVTKEHYVFDGWYSNANFTGSKVTSITKGSTGDRTLYAKFTPTKYNITYDTAGGTLSGAVYSYTYEDELLLVNPTRNGYKFLGWYDQATGGNKVERIELNSYGDKKFYARWEVIEYTITYIGSSVHDNPLTYTIESDTIVLTKAFKDHYTFANWYADANFAGSPVISIQKGTYGNLTYYAKFTPVNYTITYQLDGGSLSGAETSYTYESDFALRLPTKTGYKFLGWYDQEEGGNKVERISLHSSGNKVFYAKWEIISYDIIYTLNGGENNSENITEYTIETDTFILKAPIREGYEFVNWVNSYNLVVTQITKGSTGTITLTAQWKIKDYEITYELDGGKNNASNPNTYTILTPTFTLLAATKEGYDFAGWYLDSDFTEKIEEIENGSKDSITLYAKFIPNEFEISFETNGGSSIDSIKYKTGEAIDLPVPTKEGQSLEGWYTDESLTTKFNSGVMVPYDLKLYAKWRSYDVLFDNTDLINAIKVTQDLTDAVALANLINLKIYDTDGKEPSNVEVDVAGKAEAGGTIDLIFTAEGIRSVTPRILTVKVNVYGMPTIVVNNPITKINDDTVLDAALFGLSGKDSFGQNTTLKVLVSKEDYAAGDIIDITLQSIDKAGNITEEVLEDIKVFGNPTITVNDVVDINIEDEITLDLFEVVAKDSFGNALTINMTVTGSKVAGSIVTVELSAQEENGKTVTKTIELNVYGNPTISYTSTLKFKVDDKIDAKALGVIAKDSFGKELENVTVTFVSGQMKAGDTVSYLITATDHMGNSASKFIKDIKIYGDPVIDYDSTKTAIRLLDDINYILNDIAYDSFGNLLYTKVEIASGTFASGETVVLKISATDELGNVTNVEHTVKIYGLQDIDFTYNLGKSEVSIHSKGQEFNVTGTDSFGEDLTIELVNANGSKLVAGQTQNIRIKAIDAAGNYKLSEIITNIKVYDNPSLDLRSGNTLYITKGTNLRPTYFVSKDSFGVELYPNITILEGSTDTVGLIKIKVEVKDIANNTVTKVFEMYVIEDEYFVELVVDDNTDLEQRVVAIKLDEDYKLPVPTKQHYEFVGWYIGSKAYTDEFGNSINPWEHDNHDVKLTAKFEVINYDITYELDGGTNPVYQETKFNINSASNLLAPTKKGYTFKGWYLEDTFETKVTNLSELELKDVTLYARFEVNYYDVVFSNTEQEVKVTFYTDTNSVWYTQVGNYNGKLTLPSNPSKYGYIFIGWKNKATGDMYYFDEEITENLDLIAVFEQATTFSISNMYINTSNTSFRTYKALFTGQLTVNVSFSNYYTRSVVIYEDGSYKGISPSTSSAINYTFNVTAGKTYTIYLYCHTNPHITNVSASITPNPGTITSNAYFKTVFETKEVAYDDYFDGRVLYKDYYRFLGWYDKDDKQYVDGDGKGTNVLDVNSSLVLYPKFELIEYNLEYELDGGTNPANQYQTFNYLSKETLHEAIKKGYTFKGWYLEDTFETKITKLSDLPIKDVKLYAKFEANNYDVTFTKDVKITYYNQDGSIYYTQIGPYGTKITPPSNPTLIDGYIFMGWKDKETGLIYNFDRDLTDDLELVPYMEQPLSFYQSIYLYYGSGYTVYSNYISFNGQLKVNITFSNSSYSRYIRIYENSTQIATTPSTTGSITYTINVTKGNYYYINLYSASYNHYVDVNAKLTPTIGSIYSTAYLKGIYETRSIQFDSEFTQDVLDKDGYKFMGWADSNGKLYIDKNGNNLIALDEDKLLYLHPVFEYIYKIDYVLDGGENPIDQYLEFTKSSTEDLLPATKEGYKFAGWFTDSEFVNEVTKLSDLELKDTKLYAKFEKIYKIEYVLDGGENPIDQYLEFTASSTEDLLPATKEGYKFAGWFTDSEFVNEVTKLSDLEL